MNHDEFIINSVAGIELTIQPQSYAVQLQQM